MYIGKTSFVPMAIFPLVDIWYSYKGEYYTIFVKFCWTKKPNIQVHYSNLQNELRTVALKRPIFKHEKEFVHLSLGLI
jgi:hypothetical protein